MNHCVPEWDVPCRDLDVRMHSTGVTSTSKSKWSFAEKRPENDFEQLCWESGQHFAMQSRNEKLQKQRHCSVQPSCDILTIPHCEGAVPTSRFNVCEKNGMLFDAVIPDALVTDAPVTGKCLEDDDLVSWIQYQAEEPLDNCNELLTGINKATFIWNDIEAPVYSVSRSESVTNDTSGKPMDNPCYDSLLIFPSDNLEMAVSSNTASGSMIHASSLPCRMNAFFTQSEPSLKQAPSIPSFPCSTNTNSGGNSSNTLNTAIPRSAQVSCEMPPPKKRQGTGSDWSQSQYGNSGLMNFPQFSRPAATLKARLNAYRLSSGMDQSKQLDKPAIEARVSAESSAESSITDMSLSGNPKDTSLPSAAALKPHKLESENHLENLPSRNEIVCCANDPGFTNYRSGNVSRALNSCSTSNPLSSTEKETVSNALGHTLASTSKGSGGSDIMTGDSLQKRKNQEAECSECQSDDPDDEPDDLKKHSPAKMASAKRSRAAEIHNLSERRRRDRINEKMKALQELIPNCNKTDKASLLEEVIEYLKMLQTQLQVMTYRTGMGMSPMLIPPAMQHLQMAQLAAMPHWGMGMGMGMGVGMNMEMMEKAAASASRHILPFPSFPGLLVPGSAVLPMPGSIPMSTPGSTVFSSAVSALPSEFAGTPFCATPHLARFPSAAVDLPPSSHKVDSIYQNLQPPNTNMYNTSGINQHHHRLPDKYATAGPSPQ